MIASLSILTGMSAALLLRCLSNFRAIGKVYGRISRLRDFTRSCGKTSYRLVNKGPGSCITTAIWRCRKPIKQEHCTFSLQWRHNDHGGVSNHQPCGCLLNRLFIRRWKKTSKLRVTGLCAGIHRDRWIPRTKGQQRGKWFHLMTSSCIWKHVTTTGATILSNLSHS